MAMGLRCQCATLPGLEEMGIRMLLNECEHILRGDQAIYLAGIDDAHYYRVDNIEKAASEIPDDGFSVLLSHTPEIYRQAAHGGFDLLVSGHTHGGSDLSAWVYPNHS
jgi:predicted MPP superfamily phosphohydrolase